MQCHGNHGHKQQGAGGNTTRPARLLYWSLGLAALAAVIWWLVSTGNTLFLGYGLLLLCPLMHLMGGHRHGGRHQAGDATRSGDGAGEPGRNG